MSYEVEMKFPVADEAALRSRLAELGGTLSPPQLEVDVYFAHPARDFAKTDEALRIRRKGSLSFITYKGPKIDAATKTRREIELPLSPGGQAAQAWTDLVEALGFRPVGEVRKSRRKARLDWHGRGVEISLDEVAELGVFIELELIAEAEGLDAARSNILSLAETIGLQRSERRSYLELLLARPANCHVATAREGDGGGCQEPA